MKEIIHAAEGLVWNGGTKLQRVFVPETTIDRIMDAGGIGMMEGQEIELVPAKMVGELLVPNKGAGLIPIFDVLVEMQVSEERPDANN